MTCTVDLFDVGRQSLAALIGELATHDVHVHPDLELRRGDGLLCYYNLADGHIYLSAPDPGRPRGRFELLLLRALIKLDSNEEVLRLLQLLTPWLIAHEVGHHLRHKYVRRHVNVWEEERIANQLAGAFIRRNLDQRDMQELSDMLAGAIANLSDTLGARAELHKMHMTRDPVCYVYFHMRGFYADLMQDQALSIGAFVQTYLQAFAMKGGDAQP